MGEPSRTLMDNDLNETLRELRVELLELGETGHLQSGVQSTKTAASGRIDPLSAALRWSTKISCRPYAVSGPNYLWHIRKLCQQERETRLEWGAVCGVYC